MFWFLDQVLWIIRRITDIGEQMVRYAARPRQAS